MQVPETLSLPGKSDEVNSSSTVDEVSFKYGVYEVVSLTSLDVPVVFHRAAVVDTYLDENVLFRSTALAIPVVFLGAAVVDTILDDNVLLSEIEYVDIGCPWSVLLLRYGELFSSLVKNVVTRESVEDVFEGEFDAFPTETQSAGRFSVHLRIFLSTSPFGFILAATQKSGYPPTSIKYNQVYFWSY